MGAPCSTSLSVEPGRSAVGCCPSAGDTGRSGPSKTTAFGGTDSHPGRVNTRAGDQGSPRRCLIPSPKGRERLPKLRRPVDGSSDMSKIGTRTYTEALDPLDLSCEFLNALRRHLDRPCDVVGVRVKQHEHAGVEVPGTEWAVAVASTVACGDEPDLHLEATIADSNVPALLRRRRQLAAKRIREEVLSQISRRGVPRSDDPSMYELRQDVGVESEKRSGRQLLEFHRLLVAERPGDAHLRSRRPQPGVLGQVKRCPLATDAIVIESARRRKSSAKDVPRPT